MKGAPGSPLRDRRASAGRKSRASDADFLPAQEEAEVGDEVGVGEEEEQQQQGGSRSPEWDRGNGAKGGSSKDGDDGDDENGDTPSPFSGESEDEDEDSPPPSPPRARVVSPPTTNPSATTNTKGSKGRERQAPNPPSASANAKPRGKQPAAGGGSRVPIPPVVVPPHTHTAKKASASQSNDRRASRATSDESPLPFTPSISTKGAPKKDKAKTPPQQPPLKSPSFKLRTTPPDLKAYTKVITRLKEVYRRHILPLEMKYQFNKFGYEPITDAELEAKAQVLLIGQYSTGKTTMVRYLLGQDFPGMHCGPEPTTDRFMAIVHGEEDSVIEGPLLEVTPELPYQGLSKQFGPALLSKFQASVSSSGVLRHVTFVDTPGILSGEKQRLSRQYDFPAVIRWLAERSDMVLVLFDVNKLDISDEFKEVLENLKGLSNKVRLVLNKADSVRREELTRCYGAMMWSMSRVLGSPEVPKVNIGSFWDQPYRVADSDTLFDFAKDETNLINDLGELSRDNPKKKINGLIHRIHVLKVYMRLMATLRSRVTWFYQDHTRQALLAALPDILEEIRLRFKLPAGDMPPVDVIKQRLSAFPDFSAFALNPDNDIQQLDRVISQDLATLMTELGGVTKPVNANSDLKDHAHFLSTQLLNTRVSVTGVLLALGVATLALVLGLLFLALIWGTDGVKDFISEL